MKRFLDKVRMTESCWLWTGAIRGKSGYGAFKFNNKVIDAHRMTFMLHKGEIPQGMLVCHKCDNRICVNPDHLFLGSISDNMKDCANKGRLGCQIAPIKHGTQSRYSKGCRCAECKKAHKINNLKWKQRRLAKA